MAAGQAHGDGIRRLLPVLVPALLVVTIPYVSAAAYGKGRLKLRAETSQDVHQRSSGFESLAECEVSYDTLYSQCRSTAAAAAPDAGSPGKTMPSADSLTGDEEGSSYKRKGKDPYVRPGVASGWASKAEGWDYRMHGDDWAHLGECSGPNQSPVDLPKYVGSRGQTKSLLWFDYFSDPGLQADTQAQLINDGHGISMDLRQHGMDFGFVKIADKEFQASEYTFHSPSEHLMDGASFPLELQIYNFDTAEKGSGETSASPVAISIFFREGESNPFLAGLRKATKGLAPSWTTDGKGVSMISGEFKEAFDLEHLIPKVDPAAIKSFYNYRGSLTQPPCTEGVDWWVLSRPIPAAREEIRFIRRAIFGSESMKYGNARNPMPLGNRSIIAGQADYQNVLKNGRRMWARDPE